MCFAMYARCSCTPGNVTAAQHASMSDGTQPALPLEVAVQAWRADFVFAWIHLAPHPILLEYVGRVLTNHAMQLPRLDRPDTALEDVGAASFPATAGWPPRFALGHHSPVRTRETSLNVTQAKLVHQNRWTTLARLQQPSAYRKWGMRAVGVR